MQQEFFFNYYLQQLISIKFNVICLIKHTADVQISSKLFHLIFFIFNPNNIWYLSAVFIPRPHCQIIRYLNNHNPSDAIYFSSVNLILTSIKVYTCYCHNNIFTTKFIITSRLEVTEFPRVSAGPGVPSRLLPGETWAPILHPARELRSTQPTCPIL